MHLLSELHTDVIRQTVTLWWEWDLAAWHAMLFGYFFVKLLGAALCLYYNVAINQILWLHENVGTALILWILFHFHVRTII